MNESSLNIFMALDIGGDDPEDPDPSMAWNGPRFEAIIGDSVVCLASTVVMEEAGRVHFSLTLMKLEGNAKYWQALVDGKWVDGPPKNVFESLDDVRWDEIEQWMDFEDWLDVEEREESVESLIMPQNIINALVMAGIEKIDDLVEMTAEELIAIRGIGKKSLERIRTALDIIDRSLKDEEN